MFLDPLIVVRGQDGQFWTPNGRHRLAAAKVLGLKQITALICPDESLAYRILALNTEKAHNLKDRSLEVIRMARNLAKRESGARETKYQDQFESSELLTLGILYEKNPRFAGGAYSSFLRKIDRFSERTLAASLREREGYAARLLAIDAEVKKIIAALSARGFKSPYLRNYVVARINPVRFIKQARGVSQAGHADRPGAHAHDRGGEGFQAGVGFQCRPRLGGGRRRGPGLDFSRRKSARPRARCARRPRPARPWRPGRRRWPAGPRSTGAAAGRR